MVSPVIAKGSKHAIFYLNLDANVGVNSPNRPDDVQLVQFGFYAMAVRNKDLPASERAAYVKVIPGAAYTGAPNDPLTIAIRTHQAARGGTQDGHVSVMNANLTYIDGHASRSFQLAPLVNSIRFVTAGDYPRIDRHPMCPSLLKAAVLSACGE